MNNIFQKGSRVYCVGIKGTGMSALAELMHRAGVLVTGSDTAEVFYTDAILREIGIPYFEDFDAAHIGASIDGASVDAVIHSAAYSPDTNPELAEAEKLGIPILKYTEALGLYSALFDASGIAGVHGKTTTAAMTGSVLRGMSMPAQVLAGSAVSGFGNRSTLSLGDKYFVAETCEYRKHFLSFCPKRIVLTSVESDHQDYYPTYNDIRDAFVEYGQKLPAGGELIYCADDAGAREVAAILKKGGGNAGVSGGTDSGNDGKKTAACDNGADSGKSGGNNDSGITFTPYGFGATGDFRITDCQIRDERLVWTLAGFSGPFALRVPGRHSVLDATAAIALASSIVKGEGGWNDERLAGVKAALEGFRGSKRRSEILGEAGGVLFMDDYGHHPTAIRTTIEGLKAFYPKRRLIVSFMSHTYTRTAALLDEFAAALSFADIVILHKIYASAREKYSGGVTGRTLFKKTVGLRDNVLYEEEPLDALPALRSLLKEGDLFLTMGAGDNWKLGKALYESLCESRKVMENG